jgi:hypothetical protein
MCRIPASGSSWKSFAREGVAMDDPGFRTLEASMTLLRRAIDIVSGIVLAVRGSR